ncbi:hypothetical protein [Clostridioides difficile]|uniref:hypothetical protein n=1 Tax=Clostridioides difficile TaxID=1496 RepID=UPI00374F1C90
MLEKLNENASLSQLITAFESSTNEIKTTKNNIVNILGNPFLEGTRFSEFETKLQTLITTFKNNLKSKSVSISDIETLESLINKVSNISGYKSASGVATHTYTDYLPITITTNLDFVPRIVYVLCSIPFYKGSYCRFANNITYNFNCSWDSNEEASNLKSLITDVRSESFRIRFYSYGNEYTKPDTRPDYNDIRWYAYGFK